MSYNYEYNKDKRGLSEARAKAGNLGLNWQTLAISEKEGKRFKILSDKNKWVHFGSWPFAVGTYLDHRDEKMRTAWKKRHATTLRDGQPAFMDEDSPLYYSWRILW